MKVSWGFLFCGLRKIVVKVLDFNQDSRYTYGSDVMLGVVLKDPTVCKVTKNSA